MARSVRSPAVRPALLAALLATWLVPAARAALADRGGGMRYDTVLDVTWLAAARDWVDNLEYGGFSDWRLPSTGKAGADWVRVFSYDGSTDIAYNITSPRSELSYMYYVNLGLAGEFNPDGTHRDDWGVFGNGTLNGTDGNSYGERDIGLVRNLQAFIYWSGSTDGPANGVAWTLHTSIGMQSRNGPNGLNHAWAVRTGDVQAVPEPATALLAGLGHAGAAVLRRRPLTRRR